VTTDLTPIYTSLVAELGTDALDSSTTPPTPDDDPDS